MDWYAWKDKRGKKIKVGDVLLMPVGRLGVVTRQSCGDDGHRLHLECHDGEPIKFWRYGPLKVEEECVLVNVKDLDTRETKELLKDFNQLLTIAYMLIEGDIKRTDARVLLESLMTGVNAG